MKNKITTPALLAMLLVFSTSSFADAAVNNMVFDGKSKLTLQPLKKKEGECLSFEASFTDALKKEPTAILDVENHFMNVMNAFLDVIKISDTKYRFTLAASAEKECPKIEKDTQLTISTYSETVDEKAAVDPEQHTGPSEITFPGSKIKK